MKKNYLVNLRDDEINLIELIKFIWVSKNKIIIATLISFLIGIGYYYLIPKSFEISLKLKTSSSSEFIQLFSVYEFIFISFISLSERSFLVEIRNFFIYEPIASLDKIKIYKSKSDYFNKIFINETAIKTFEDLLASITIPLVEDSLNILKPDNLNTTINYYKKETLIIDLTSTGLTGAVTEDLFNKLIIRKS